MKIASGGDPTYAFNVRLTGEEVHGTSKSIKDGISLMKSTSSVCLFLALAKKILKADVLVQKGMCNRPRRHTDTQNQVPHPPHI